MDLQELLENARRNEALLRRLQAFELQLLSCQTWLDLLKLLLEGLPRQFDLDAIGLKLCDSDGEVKAAMQLAMDMDGAALLKKVEFHQRLPVVAAGSVAAPAPWQSALQLPLLRNQNYLGQLTLYSARHDRFGGGMATDFMQHLAAVIAACLVMVKQSEEQARLALTDPLTSAENRRGFERAFEREWARGLRHYHVFAVILLDIDHFKQINDVHGHATGDRALKNLCRSLRQIMRPTDHIGRLGGEEFALIIPGCDMEQLHIVVERIQHTIRTMSVLNDQGQTIPMTASGSYLSLMPRPHNKIGLSQVIDHLDTFLYQAKRNGRDQFIAAEKSAV